MQIDRVMDHPYYYDCGIELTSSGDYGNDFAYDRDVLSLKAEYLMLFVNLSAFVISLYTQPNGEELIHGKVISQELPVRNYCAAQLFAVWHHLQQSMSMSVEDVALLLKISLETFLQNHVTQVK